MSYNVVTIEPSNFNFDFDNLVWNMAESDFKHIGNLVFKYDGTEVDYDDSWFQSHVLNAIEKSDDLGLVINVIFDFHQCEEK